jgi:1,4-alpha-glucan branching enzyme
MARLAATKSAEFKLYAPQAKGVSVAGNFNNWSTKKLSAKKDPRGNWTVNVNLKPGRYEYKFFVDGSWLTDPRNGMTVTNSFGSQNSIMEVK